jgi:hypothetical protein
MKRQSRISILAAAGLLAACSAVLVNVPVAGPPTALRQLEGEWFGEYSGGPGGREGGLVFKLETGEKVAAGEVWMNTRGPNVNYPGSAPSMAMPTQSVVAPIPIRFVWIEENMVTGTLDLYRDPETDHILLTTFRGRVEGDVISGTFVTEDKNSGAMTSGAWSAKRVARSSETRP